MESDAFHLTENFDPTGALVIAAGGSPDGAGGIELSREANAAFEAGHRRHCIDLEEVVLFNCAGARHLRAVLEEFISRDGQVDLVRVRPPLQRVLDFAA